MAIDERDIQLKRIPQPPPEEAVVETGLPDEGSLEAKLLNRGLLVRDLKKEADEADHERAQKFKDHFELMAIYTVWALYAGFVAFGGVWAWHTLIPQWGWLKPDQLEKVQGLLTGGVIAGLVADHVKKRMG